MNRGMDEWANRYNMNIKKNETEDKITKMTRKEFLTKFASASVVFLGTGSLISCDNFLLFVE